MNSNEVQPEGAVLMLQGTASDVGKSVITTALCRIFKQDGFRVAPFKSQNMALNSYVTPDGLEIGRAQGVQAEACGIPAVTDMNPILIKPTGDMHSQVVVHGRPLSHMSAAAYRSEFLPTAKPVVLDALERLRSRFDIVVMEGAGSPAEINLKDRDIVNMNLAGWADAPVLLVADIDRGGVFAFLVGTLELLTPSERARVQGFIINKFRGDLALLKPGLDWLKERTGIPVLGVLPFLPDLEIEAEDSVVLDSYPAAAAGRHIDIAVIRYPRISNFTDFDPLGAEEDVSLRYVSRAEELGIPDVIILPGSKNTIADLGFLRDQGLDKAIALAMQKPGTRLVGICGGYQMLGRSITDPEAYDSAVAGQTEGLGWLPVDTVFQAEKRTTRVSGYVLPDQLHSLCTDESAMWVEGYEIHMGDTRWCEECSPRPLFELSDASSPSDKRWLEGAISEDGTVMGTYLHGVFENDIWRRAWLNAIRVKKGLEPVDFTFYAAERKERAFDRLAAAAREHLNLERIYEIAGLRKQSSDGMPKVSGK
ncbi:cobyric acid synthase [Paenibacillus sp. J22TS3]|uniref:cobyric acid synthase n=1 Tax=Paenibacillus sp. J22TS3 TaxID=2807192 RepID=UPI001B063512|nr:cobyric acid synthase [Paenibacillus sp. J22TS3]GIP22547.1 cobyric acid synthase [Paenibacillus sp. J22TS3]